MGIFNKLVSAIQGFTDPSHKLEQLDDKGLLEAEALIVEGNLLEDANQLDQALALYEKAVRLAPTFARTHLNLGNVLLALGRPEAAIEAYSTALAHKPDLAAAYFNLGNAHVACRRPYDALKAYDQALSVNACFVDALVAKANVHGDLKDFKSAVIGYQHALNIKPDYVEVRMNLGNTLKALGRLDEAIRCFGEVINLAPESAESYHNLGLAYKGLDRPVDAMRCFKEAVALNPTYVAAQLDLANAFREAGDIRKAIEIARQTILIDPNESGAWSLLFFCLSDSEDIDTATLFAEHRRFGEYFERSLGTIQTPHVNTREPDRILKVGIVSGDLCNHSVANFFEPVLLQLLSMVGLSIHVYETSGREDDVSRRIKARVKFWNDVEMLSFAALEGLIREHCIDVLIDLSGHTPGNRLLTFARKPAPVQMSWIGYPGTTGLSSIDYYVGDRHFLPIGKYDNLFSEKIIRLPANAPFQPAPYAPEVNSLPALQNGHLTFGSFNRIDKISPSVVALWSRVLTSVPESKMIIGGMPSGGGYDQIIAWFSEAGVTRERLDFHCRSGMSAYLMLHHEVDICLDTFPYGGGTTTCHAMWMGVPTLTLEGQSPTGEAGRSILSHVGLQDIFCVRDMPEFVDKARWCAENLHYMQDLRGSLRSIFQRSVLLQPSIVARGLELAIRHAWGRWCADLPPRSFEVVYDNGDYDLI